MKKNKKPHIIYVKQKPDYIKSKKEFDNNIFNKIYDNQMLLFRTIISKPRCYVQSELISKKLAANHEFKNILLDFEKKIHLGENINNYLSTNIHDSNDIDFLFNLFKIHHFHLPDINPIDCVSDRTSILLYAYITDDCFYALDIGDHRILRNPISLYNNLLEFDILQKHKHDYYNNILPTNSKIYLSDYITVNHNNYNINNKNI